MKPFDEPRPMLEHPANQIIRHADIKNAVRSIGQNVNVPAACHAEILQDVDGRDKPGHDGLSKHLRRDDERWYTSIREMIRANERLE